MKPQYKPQIKFLYSIRDEDNIMTGRYESKTFIGLLWRIFIHRLSHFIKGDGWTD